MKLCITGANGFVGQALVKQCLKTNIAFHRAVRANDDDLPNTVSIGNIGAHTDWSSALAGCTEVIHLAARVHQMRDAGNTIDLYRKVNVEGTRKLLSDAIAQPIKRFVFVSTIKVLGEHTNTPWDPQTSPNPQCPYSLSKLEAEVLVKQMCEQAGIEWVIVRPPLVYGSFAKGNIPRLVKLIHRTPFLPLGGIENRRSMVNVNNLANLLLTCASHPKANHHIFHVSDNEHRSTSDLIEDCAYAMHKKLRMFSCPSWIARALFFCLRKSKEYERLYQSLVVNDTLTREVLGWSEPTPYLEALRDTVLSYRKS
jgi:UDP-glucose 4-epimerase